jgi:hypothetical protein
VCREFEFAEKPESSDILNKEMAVGDKGKKDKGKKETQKKAKLTLREKRKRKKEKGK